MREKVFQKIRDDILKGRYKKGDELVECTIGGELGVSRTPVREAIRQLALEGLVQIIPNKGAFVTGISARDVMDMYQIRARLEGLCASMAAEHASREQLEGMEEALYFLIIMRERAIMIRCASRTADSMNFYMKHREAGSLRIP